MTDPELLSLLTALPLSDDRSRPAAEREAFLLRESLAERAALRARVEALATSRRDAIATAAREAATDPLTLLAAPLTPASPDDTALLGFGSAVSLPEFRRNGKRYQYVGAAPTACIPAADWQLFGDAWVRGQYQRISCRGLLICSARDFDDVLGMAHVAHASQVHPAQHASVQPGELISALIGDSARSAAPALVRWYRFSSSSELPGRADVAYAIRQRLGQLGVLELIDTGPTDVEPSGLPPTYVPQLDRIGGEVS